VKRTPDDPAATGEHMAAILRQYETAINNQDAVALAALFTDDAQRVPPGEAPIQFGPAAVQAGQQALFDEFTFAVTFDIQDTGVDGNVGWAVGEVQAELTPKAGGDKKSVVFVTLCLMRPATDGRWKIHRQIWSIRHRPTVTWAPGNQGT
jgi:uncharacterized protein (TIGR02246 family)